MNKKGKTVDGIPGLGDRLRLFRKSCGYSAQELSDLIQAKHEDSSITRQVIFNIENGRKTDLTITELVYLSDAIGLPYTALLCDLTQPFLPIESGPFAHKSTYDVIDDFDPRKSSFSIDDQWYDINLYLDPATELIQSIGRFTVARNAFLHSMEEKDGASQVQLIAMESALSFMEADLQDLEGKGVYVPERYSKKVAEARTELNAFKAKIEKTVTK